MTQFIAVGIYSYWARVAPMNSDQAKRSHAFFSEVFEANDLEEAFSKARELAKEASHSYHIDELKVIAVVGKLVPVPFSSEHQEA